MPIAASVQVPAPGPDSVYCTLYQRNRSLAALAEAELYALGGGSSPEIGVWLSPAPIRWARCGYGNGGGRQLAFGATLGELEAALRALHLAAPRFCITTRRLPRDQEGTMAAKVLIGDCIAGDVSLDDPLLRLLLVVSPLGYRLLLEERAEEADTGWLAFGHKPRNYLVAVPIRLAQAMLHLTVRSGDAVLDPFCGVGTIPLLAAWAGHRAFGSDISALCLAHSAENLEHFGLEAVLTRVDARDQQQQADCIISNLPYGLYSHFSAGALRAILRNLGRLAPRITLVTAERIEEDLRAEGYQVEQVIPVESERFERLVHVTRAPGAAARCPASPTTGQASLEASERTPAAVPPGT